MVVSVYIRQYYATTYGRMNINICLCLYIYVCLYVLMTPGLEICCETLILFRDWASKPGGFNVAVI